MTEGAPPWKVREKKVLEAAMRGGGGGGVRGRVEKIKTGRRPKTNLQIIGSAQKRGKKREDSEERRGREGGEKEDLS